MTPRDRAVEDLNRIHAVLAGNGKVRVMRFKKDGTFDLESVFDFRQWYSNRTIAAMKSTAKGDVRVDVPVADVWLQHPDRLQFEGIVFDPRDPETSAFNMWRGFSVRPNKHLGYCDTFLAHLRDNVCNGNEEHFTWLVAWMAHLIQRPWEKPGVAVVLKGLKGVGKSIVGDVLRALLTHHTVAVSQPRHLVGNFNAHLARALLVLVEEAFWAGDKTSEGALKDQITGATIRVEKKGFDVEEMPSFHRYLITGNAEWIVPATHDERRYAVFNVADTEKGNEAYFSRMMEEMRAGGYEALMHHLRTFDLSGVDVRKAPNTKGLAEQKLANLQNVYLWWFDVLSEGAFPDWADAEGDWSAGAISVPTAQFRKVYERWHGAHRFQGELARPDAFGRALKEMCPGEKRAQRRVKGERWREHVRAYRLPPLPQCRAEFARWIGADDGIDWGE